MKLTLNTLLVLFLSCFSVLAQFKEKWQRVYTGDDSVIDINLASSRLEPDHSLRVDYRTVLSKPENVRGRPGTQYKTRIETIRFKLTTKHYRVSDETLLDSSGNKLETYTAPTENWRPMKAGGMMEKLFTAVSSLPPFGSWKVVEYRFVDGPKASPERDLQKLIGTHVRLETAYADVASKICSSVSYEDRSTNLDTLRRELGEVKLDPMIDNDQAIESVRVKCEVSGWAPTPSLLIKVKDDDMLMLWQGVFLVLKRDYQWNVRTFPPVKRAQ